jgi:hypothetical protein
MPWSDEQLSAYLDGELPPPEAEALGQEVKVDAPLAARLAQLERAQTAFVRSVESIDRRPLPASIEKLLRPPEDSVLMFRSRPGLVQQLIDRRAIAASLLVAAIAVGGFVITAEPRQMSIEPGALIARNGPLHDILEAKATGESGSVEDGEATPRLSFATAEAYCRQFDLAAAARLTSAVACREPEGWRIHVAVLRDPGATGFQSADAAKSPVLEAFIEANIEGAPLNAAAEAQRISKGWDAPQ